MLKLVLILLTFTSLSSLAFTYNSNDVAGPYQNTESFNFTSTANCYALRQLRETSQHFFENVQKSGGTLNISDGRIIECIVPIESDRYIRSVVFSAYGGVPALRSCTMSPMEALGNQEYSVNMPIVSWNNRQSFRHDDLGLVPFYVPNTSNSRHQTALKIRCLTGVTLTGQSTKFGNIRVDYDL